MGGGFLATSYAEYGVLTLLQKNPVRDHYLSTTGLALSLFLLFVSNRHSAKNTLLSKIGEKDSLYIYIFHPLFLMFFEAFNRVVTQPEWLFAYNFLAPFLVLSLTMLLIFVLRKVRLIA